MFFCSLFGLFVHMIFSYVFVLVMKMEHRGTGIAQALTNTVIGLILYLYTVFDPEM